MKFFKSKFFIITLITAILIAVTFTAMSALGYSSYIRSGLNTLLIPFQKLADAAGRAVAGYASYASEVERLREENKELRSQMIRMENEVKEAEAIRGENEQLKKYLELKTEHFDYTFENADVVGRQAGNYMTSFTLSRGKNYGIEPDMPIIDENGGLIGCITDSGGTWSSACSLLDPSSSVGAYVERSLAAGVISGDYALGLDGECRLGYLPEGADVRVGDRILTSGIGSIYPRGLVIGTVTEVKVDESLRTKYAVVRPYADISDLSSVMVLTSFEKYVDD